MKPKKSAQTASGDKKRFGILKAVLAKVPAHGWTDAAFEEALKAARIPRAVADDLMPGGIGDAVGLFAEEIDNAMAASIKSSRTFARMRVREKIAFGVRARLEAMEPHREAVKRLLVWYAMPLRAPKALSRLYRTVDLIWQAAGDTATDYNFYTKRLLLAAVFKTTLLFWLGDETPGSEATWAFLDRRIHEVVRAGKAISLLKELRPAEVVEMVRKKARRG